MRFDRDVKPGGYAWWYIDAISDDGENALTLIAFIGSVFSPYYAWANRKAPAAPLDHCAINLVLYNKRGGAWAMTERSQASVGRLPDTLCIGPSRLEWDGKVLGARIHEMTVPSPRRLSGTLRVTPAALHAVSYALDDASRHRWHPIAPTARIEVSFARPELSWQGSAYLDSNEGDAPLARDFLDWTWSRTQDGEVLYDVRRRDGSAKTLALRFHDDQAIPFKPPPRRDLPRTAWRVARATRADQNAEVRIVRTLEDAPFYARSLLETRLAGERRLAVHESLSLTRFAAPWVQLLLPFRMPRR